MAERLHITADRNGTVEQLLARQPGLSRRQISRLKFLPAGLLVNGIPARSVTPVKPGDDVSLWLHESSHRHPVPYRILFEDALLLVVDKPAGLVVHPSPGHEQDSMQSVLEAALGHPLYLKGRLDKDTSGILVFGKASWVPSLTKTKKRYLALCHGQVQPQIICTPLKLRDRTMVPSLDGKSALTYVTPVRSIPGGTLVSVKIEHGRMHQIRAHMASAGHPLLQDPLYGSSCECGASATEGRAMLHCAAVTLRHPVTGDRLDLAARPPDDFLALCGVSSP